MKHLYPFKLQRISISTWDLYFSLFYDPHKASDEWWMGFLFLLEMDTLRWNAEKCFKWKLDDLILFMWLRKWKCRVIIFLLIRVLLPSHLFLGSSASDVINEAHGDQPSCRPDSHENGGCRKKQKYKKINSEILIQIH